MNVNDLVRIAAAGGGLDFDARNFSANDLVRIAAAASNHGARLVLRGLSGRDVNDLVRIGAASKGAALIVL